MDLTELEIWYLGNRVRRAVHLMLTVRNMLTLKYLVVTSVDSPPQHGRIMDQLKEARKDIDYMNDWLDRNMPTDDMIYIVSLCEMCNKRYNTWRQIA